MTDAPNLRVLDAFLALDDVPREALCTGLYPADEMLQYLRANADLPTAGDLVAYFRSGREALRCAELVLRRCGRTLGDCRRVLDFACGGGRITRYFAARLGAERVWASDIDDAATAFVADAIGATAVASASEPEDVQLPGPFDLVFVGSLFTHLPERTFARWLRVLYGSLTPDGVLLFSTHGMSVGEAAHRDATFAFYPKSETLRLDANEYGSTYVHPRAVQALAAHAGVAHMHCLERELWHIQDLHVASRAPLPQLAGYQNTEQVRAGIDSVRFPRRDHVWIGGWTKSAACHAPAHDVRLVLNGVDVCGVTMGPPEPTDHPNWVRRLWYTEGDATPLGGRDAVLAAVAVSSDGARTVADARWLPLSARHSSM